MAAAEEHWLEELGWPMYRRFTQGVLTTPSPTSTLSPLTPETPPTTTTATTPTTTTIATPTTTTGATPTLPTPTPAPKAIVLPYARMAPLQAAQRRLTTAIQRLDEVRQEWDADTGRPSFEIMEEAWQSRAEFPAELRERLDRSAATSASSAAVVPTPLTWPQHIARLRVGEVLTTARREPLSFWWEEFEERYAQPYWEAVEALEAYEKIKALATRRGPPARR